MRCNPARLVRAALSRLVSFCSIRQRQRALSVAYMRKAGLEVVGDGWVESSSGYRVELGKTFVSAFVGAGITVTWKGYVWSVAAIVGCREGAGNCIIQHSKSWYVKVCILYFYSLPS